MTDTPPQFQRPARTATETRALLAYLKAKYLTAKEKAA